MGRNRSLASQPLPARRRFIRALSSLVLPALVGMGAAGMLAGCGGGESYSPPPATGLLFAYPDLGQKNVPLGSQIVLDFPGTVSKSVAQQTIALKGPGEHSEQITIPHDGVVKFTHTSLQPHSHYSVVVKPGQTLRAGDSTFKGGDNGLVLTEFTTQYKHDAQAPGGFRIVSVKPGGKYPFVVFNTLRIRLSEPVDPKTVQAGKTLTFSSASGPVSGTLIAHGHFIVFDPDGSLDPDTTYTLHLAGCTSGGSGSGPVIESSFGNCLKQPSDQQFKPHGVGETTVLPLHFKPTADNPADLPVSDLTGEPVNVVRIASQLLGVTHQTAGENPDRGPMKTITPKSGIFNDRGLIPAVVTKGSGFESSELKLNLNGKVPSGLDSGTIHVTMLDGANSYFTRNPWRSNDNPVAVQQYFDLAITTENKQGNGAFNQTVMGVHATGLARAEKGENGEKGKLTITAVGSFPIRVNRVGKATVNFTLHLVTSGQVPEPKPDKTPPKVTARYPGPCVQAFGSGSGVEADSGPQACSDAGLVVNSFPVNASPAATFSEPLAPSSLTSQNVRLVDTGTGAAVPAHVHLEGGSVVVDPKASLDHDTAYKLTLSPAITDLAGNHFAGPKSFQFTTAPYDTSAPQTAPLLIGLHPGVPCALSGGDFLSGGNTAGNCTGVDSSNSWYMQYGVFQLQANKAIHVAFSKPVQSSTIKLANSCVTSPAASATGSATVAVEKLDDNGACTGVVDGTVVMHHRADSSTRDFKFVPDEQLSPGARYLLVICGDSGSHCTRSIQGVGGKPLNTDPYNGTGSTSVNNGVSAGGPDILMPFQAVDASDDFFMMQFTLPTADVNGNGLFDPAEHKLSANKQVVTPLIGNPSPQYLAGDSPVSIRKALPSCDGLSDPVKDMIGGVPDECIPVSVFASGLLYGTSFTIPSIVQSGRVVLHIAGGRDASGNPTGKSQFGYIVPECKGQFGSSGAQYDFKPCFTVSLDLVASAPDAKSLGSNTVTIPQQLATANLVGPILFEQNGRMVIDLANKNKVTVNADLGGNIVPSVINPGELHQQLLGRPIHGG